MNKELENAVKEHAVKRVMRWLKSQLFGKKSVEDSRAEDKKEKLYEVKSGDGICFTSTNLDDAQAIYYMAARYSRVQLICEGKTLKTNIFDEQNNSI